MRRAHIFLFSCILLFAARAAAEPVTFQALLERSIEALAGNQSGDYDAEQITLVGHSAGGHLALLASQPERDLPVSYRHTAIVHERRYERAEFQERSAVT